MQLRAVVSSLPREFTLLLLWPQLVFLNSVLKEKARTTATTKVWPFTPLCPIYLKSVLGFAQFCKLILRMGLERLFKENRMVYCILKK